MIKILIIVRKISLGIASERMVDTSLFTFIYLVLCSSTVNSFWFLSNLPLSMLSSSNPTACENLPGLLKGQRHLCHEQPEVLVTIGEGVRTGLEECQNQFKNYRWNCSAIEKEEYAKSAVKAVGSREGAFVHAISSAGVVYSITRGCSSGDLSNCACDRKIFPNGELHRDEKGNFTWTGCSDNVRYAVRFARRFVTMVEKERLDKDDEDQRHSRSRALINLHNNRLGRKIIQDNLVKECKCHGVSGSCTVRTCWLTVPPFSKTGDLLRQRYEDAKEVQISQDGAEMLINEKDRVRPPKKSDMVFFDTSPDYCSSNAQTGTIGTGGRICRLNSTGPDSCQIMCCGRGYDTRRIKVVEKCRCKFQWCCEVKCEECEREIDEQICKPESGSHRPQHHRPRERRNRKGSRKSANFTRIVPVDSRNKSFSSIFHSTLAPN